MIEIRHRNIELEWNGFPFLYKKGSFLPLKLRYNGSAGWWIERKIFVSYNQIKKILFFLLYQYQTPTCQDDKHLDKLECRISIKQRK